MVACARAVFCLRRRANNSAQGASGKDMNMEMRYLLAASISTAIIAMATTVPMIDTATTSDVFDPPCLPASWPAAGALGCRDVSGV